MRFPSFAFEHKIEYPCSFGISFLNNWKEIVLHFQQEDVIQQHGHSQETSKSNSPTILLAYTSGIKYWDWMVLRVLSQQKHGYIIEVGMFLNDTVFGFCWFQLFLFLYWSLRKPLQHLKYMLPFDFSMAGTIKTYFGQVWVGGCSGWVI